MIYKALNLVESELNNYIKSQLNNGDSVALSYIVDNNGKLMIDNNNLGVTLLNIEEEKVLKHTPNTSSISKGCNPELKLNLYILIAANFGNYVESLKHISHVVSFFQSKNVFTKENSPNLDPEIERLIIEYHTTNFEQLNQIWSSIGAKYLPSIMYKVKTLVINQNKTREITPSLSSINIKQSTY